jgi:putative hydroxymethylpyrimidine transport system ATP-binding protein
MRQRAALARTLCEDRPVVLMDEPFAHLDAITRFELQELAAGLLAGRTVVLVTHDPLEALRLGHQVRVLSGVPFIAGPPIEPSGAVPRDAADPALLALQAQLIAELRR